MRPDGQPTGLEAYHINQRDEGIDLHGVSGALLATTNMQMQTFVTQPDEAVEGFDGYNGDLTGDVAATLGVNCGMSTGRNGVMAFAANQRDEVRDLHDVAGALQASPGMKQQTFVASGVVTKGNGGLLPFRGTAHGIDCRRWAGRPGVPLCADCRLLRWSRQQGRWYRVSGGVLSYAESGGKRNKHGAVCAVSQ